MYIEDFQERVQNKKTLNKSSYFTDLFKRISYLSPEVYKIFDLARTVVDENSEIGQQLCEVIKPNDSNSAKREFVQKEHISERLKTGDDEWIVEGMQSLSEFPFLVKKQFLLPNKIFDRKLISKDLLVKKTSAYERKISWSEHIEQESKTSYEKSLRRQKTYILMDVSASTQHHNRLELEKAIIFAYLERNEKEFGEVYFRTFTSGTGDLFKAKNSQDYRHLLNNIIIPAIADGQTNLEQAIYAAIEDLEFYSISESPTELLIVTDGLCQLNVNRILEKSNQLKINIILIGDDPIFLSKKEMDELFAKKRKAEYEYIDKNNFSEKAKQNRQQFSSSHQHDKELIQNEIHDQRISQLEKLAELSSGKFIQIQDISSDYLNVDKTLESIQTEIIVLQEKLDDKSLSPSEIELILQEYLALKNYLNSLSKQKKNKEYTEKIGQLSEQMKQYLSQNANLMELMLQGNMSVQISRNGEDFITIKLSDLIKLLFHKFKLFFIRRSESKFVIKR